MKRRVLEVKSFKTKIKILLSWDMKQTVHSRNPLKHCTAEKIEEVRKKVLPVNVSDDWRFFCQNVPKRWV